MQEELHKNPSYGVASKFYAPLVAEVIRLNHATEVLDYGAGKGRLGVALRELVEWPLTIHHYDPAIPQWSGLPEPCEFVACIDVLEHIEPARIDHVLDDLKRVTLGLGVFTVHTGPAEKVLPDGRNAHLIQQPLAWWMPRFEARFEIATSGQLTDGFWVGVERMKT